MSLVDSPPIAQLAHSATTTPSNGSSVGAGDTGVATMRGYLHRFLTTLWGRTTAAALEASLLSITIPSTKLTWHLPAEHAVAALHATEDFAGLAGFIGALNETDDLRINLGLRARAAIARKDPRLADLDFLAPSGIRGDRRSVSALPAFSLDVDMGHEGHAADGEDLPADRDELMAWLAEVGTPPATLEVQSGHGLHLHWVFAEPIWLYIDGTPTGRLDAVRNQFKKFQKRIITNAPFHIDSTAGVEREWRLPGTWNRKISDRPRPVVLLHARDCLYNPDELAPVTQRRTREQVRLSRGFIEKAQSDLGDGLAKLKAVLASRHPQETPHEASLVLLLQGQSFAPRGKRDDTMQALVSIVVFVAKRLGVYSPELLEEVFTPSLAVWAAEPEGDTDLERELDKLRDKVERAAGDYEERRSEYAEKLQSFEAAVLEASRIAQSAAPDEEGIPHGAYQRRDGTIAIPRVVRYKHDFYLYDLNDGVYRPRTYIKEEVINELRAHWPDDRQVDLTRLTNKGDVRDLTPPELIDAFGVNATAVRQTVIHQESYYEHKDGVFYIAVAPVRDDLRPEQSDIVDCFLDVLGGEHAELLRDWLAALFRLEHPCAALYLEGPPNSGKSLFVNGAASIWKAKNPTKFEKFVHRFSYLTTPLIHIEEGVSETKGITTQFRALITERNSHTIEHKNRDPFRLDGTLRLAITANNPDAISEPGITHTQNDIEAILERVAHVKIPVTAPGWVAEVNQWLKDQGREFGWSDVLDSGEFANHAAYLAVTRDPPADRLYCVQKKLTPWHLHYIMQGSSSDSDVLQWVARFATEPVSFFQRMSGGATGRSSTSTIHTSVGGGLITVRAQELIDGWKAYMSSTPQPSLRAVNRALTKLGYREGQRYVMRLDFLRVYVEENQIGNWQAIEANLSK